MTAAYCRVCDRGPLPTVFSLPRLDGWLVDVCWSCFCMFAPTTRTRILRERKAAA